MNKFDLVVSNLLLNSFKDLEGFIFNTLFGRISNNFWDIGKSEKFHGFIF